MKILKQTLLFFMVMVAPCSIASGKCSEGSSSLAVLSSKTYHASQQLREQELQDAVLHKNTQRARELINAGVSVDLQVRPVYPGIDEMFIKDVQDAKQPTLLIYAIAQRQRELIDLLLKKKRSLMHRATI